MVCHCLLPTANTVDQKGSSAFLDFRPAGQSHATGYCYMEMCPSIPGYTVGHSDAAAASSVHNGGGGGGGPTGRCGCRHIWEGKVSCWYAMHRDLHFPWLGEAICSRPNLCLSGMIVRLPPKISVIILVKLF